MLARCYFNKGQEFMRFLALIVLSFSLMTGVCEAASNPFQPQVVSLLKPKLNTQRIEYFFGNSGVQLLEINSPSFTEKRVSNLHSVHDGKKIMRCLAIVDFTHPIQPSLAELHQEIRAGSPIGATLKHHGWNISKAPVYFSTIRLSPNVMEWMNETDVSEAALHIYELEVSKSNNSEKIHYCTIIEIHSPQYITTEYLRAIYDEQYHDFNQRTAEIESLLNRCSELIENFPFPY